MDVALLQSLVKLMQANDLNMVELRDGERRVVLQRGPTGVPMAMQAADADCRFRPTVDRNRQPTAADDESAKLLEIKSPMVGTFYTARRARTPRRL